MPETPEDLRDRARQCRELATKARDEPMRATLQRMAREFDEEAQKLEAERGPA